MNVSGMRLREATRRRLYEPDGPRLRARPDLGRREAWTRDKETNASALAPSHTEACPSASPRAASAGTALGGRSGRPPPDIWRRTTSMTHVEGTRMGTWGAPASTPGAGKSEDMPFCAAHGAGSIGAAGTRRKLIQTLGAREGL